jgi:hypothetical protein
MSKQSAIIEILNRYCDLLVSTGTETVTHTGKVIWTGLVKQMEYVRVCEQIQRLRAEASGWQPIETAPKDGTWFLATADGFVDFCAWHKTPHVPLYGFHFHSCDPEDAEECHPTHWMPLPAPPATDALPEDVL